VMCFELEDFFYFAISYVFCFVLSSKSAFCYIYLHDHRELLGDAWENVYCFIFLSVVREASVFWDLITSC